MSDNGFYIPPEIPDNPVKSRFPVKTQLGILGLLLFILLGASLLTILKPEKTNSTIVEAIAEETDTTAFHDLTVLSLNENIKLTATSAYVYDVRAKRALFNKNADEVLPLASITKLMTTLVAHELMADDDSITIPVSAVRQDGASGLKAGDNFASGALIDYALQASSNDAAYALAIAGGNLLSEKLPAESFVASMNLKATELGLSTMKFLNPTGLDVSQSEAGAYGSARDVTFLMEYILKDYPFLLTKTTDKISRVYNETGEYYTSENTNPTVNEVPNLLGSKTGYTDLAGGNLTIAFDAGYNRPIIITILGSTYTDRFKDIEKLTQAVQTAFATN